MCTMLRMSSLLSLSPLCRCSLKHNVKDIFHKSQCAFFFSSSSSHSRLAYRGLGVRFDRSPEEEGGVGGGVRSRFMVAEREQAHPATNIHTLKLKHAHTSTYLFLSSQLAIVVNCLANGPLGTLYIKSTGEHTGAPYPSTHTATHIYIWYDTAEHPYR